MSDSVSEQNKVKRKTSYMPDTNTATATPAKPTFKSEHKFDFNGIRGSLPIVTKEVTRGRTVGTIYLGFDQDKLAIEDLLNLFDKDDVMEELVRPALGKLQLQIHNIAKSKNTKKDSDGNEVLDMQGYQRDYNNLLGNLTTQSESTRALKLKSAALLKTMMEFSSKMGTSKITGDASVEGSNDWLQLQFFNTAKELSNVNQQIEDSKAKKESEEPVDTTIPATA